MELELLRLFKELVSSHLLDKSGAVALAMLLVGFVGYKYLLSPLRKQLQQKADKSDIAHMEKLVDKSINNPCLLELSKKLEDLFSRLQNIESKNSETAAKMADEVKEIKADIRDIKQILTQFQGHMLYGRNNDVRHRELR